MISDFGTARVWGGVSDYATKRGMGRRVGEWVGGRGRGGCEWLCTARAKQCEADTTGEPAEPTEAQAMRGVYTRSTGASRDTRHGGSGG